jgi:hypothetical protein
MMHFIGAFQQVEPVKDLFMHAAFNASSHPRPTVVMTKMETACDDSGDRGLDHRALSHFTLTGRHENDGQLPQAPQASARSSQPATEPAPPRSQTTSADATFAVDAGCRFRDGSVVATNFEPKLGSRRRYSASRRAAIGKRQRCGSES